jgi:hypothetical protein
MFLEMVWVMIPRNCMNRLRVKLDLIKIEIIENVQLPTQYISYGLVSPHLENPTDFPKPVFIWRGSCQNTPQLIYINVASNAKKDCEIFVNLNLNEIIMKSVNVQISDFEFNQLGLNKNTLSFSELIEIIGKKITKQTLEKSIQLANKYGLSKMTMEEIDDEIKAHRNAKNNS